MKKLPKWLRKDKRGIVPIPVLVAVIGLVLFLAVSSTASFKNSLFSALFPKQSSFAAATIIVGSGGYPTINAAIQAALPTDIISIQAGTYPEQVEVNKSVTLQKFGDGDVWVDGGNTRSVGIHITAADVVVDGIGVKQTRGQGVLMDTTTPQNVMLQNMTIQDFDSDNSGPEYEAGIGAWYTGPGMKILNNTILRRSSGSLTGGKSNGIWFKSTSAIPSGGGHTISGNTIKGTWDGIGGETEDDVHGTLDKDSIVDNNTIDTCADDGIQIEGGDVNIRIRHNTIKRCGIGIASAPNLSGPMYIEYNRITDGITGDYGQLGCFKVGDSGTGKTFYTGNTCILTGPEAGGWMQTNPGMNAVEARNNKIHTNYYVIEFTGFTNSAQSTNTSFDYDCFYTTDPNRFVKWNGNAISFNSWKSSTGNEAHGINSQTCPDPVDPDFSLVVDAIPVPSASVGPSASPTASLSPSPTPSRSPSPIPSRTPSSSPAATRTPTPTPTPRPVVQLGNLAGTITDVNNRPLRDARAVLSVNGKKKIFYTNSRGVYYASNVPVGIYSVKYARSGYTAQFINVTINPGLTAAQGAKLIRR